MTTQNNFDKLTQIIFFLLNDEGFKDRNIKITVSKSNIGYTLRAGDMGWFSNEMATSITKALEEINMEEWNFNDGFLIIDFR